MTPVSILDRGRSIGSFDVSQQPDIGQKDGQRVCLPHGGYTRRLRGENFPRRDDFVLSHKAGLIPLEDVSYHNLVRELVPSDFPSW